MLRLIAVTVAGFALVSSAQALTPAPLQQPEGMITQARLGCGPFRTRVAGVCVLKRSPPRPAARSLRVMARPRPVPQPDLDVAANISRSFEQCVGTEQECFWNHEAHGLRGPQVNGQLELRRLLYR